LRIFPGGHLDGAVPLQGRAKIDRRAGERAGPRSAERRPIEWVARRMDPGGGGPTPETPAVRGWPEGTLWTAAKASLCGVFAGGQLGNRAGGHGFPLSSLGKLPAGEGSGRGRASFSMGIFRDGGLICRGKSRGKAGSRAGKRSAWDGCRRGGTRSAEGHRRLGAAGAGGTWLRV